MIEGIEGLTVHPCGGYRHRIGTVMGFQNFDIRWTVDDF